MPLGVNPIAVNKYIVPYHKPIYTGTFPDRLKIAVVRSLYKKRDKTSMTNYRPVSLLTSFFTVPEKVMHIRLRQHLNTNNILVTEQYGFKKGYQLNVLTSD
jgi:hypothetical protein